MTKVCPNCKTNNSGSASFCQKCGEELKEPINVPQRDKKPSGGIGAWWNQQGTLGKALIGSISIFCIGFLLLFSIFLITTHNTTPIGNTTFHDNNVSFVYPNNWFVLPLNDTNSHPLVNMERNEGGHSNLLIFKTTTNSTLDFWISKEKIDSNIKGHELISTKSITVDGSPGFQIISKYSGSEHNSAEQEEILFIKNGNLYQLLFTTESVSAIQSDIDMIVNNFKVT